MSYLGATLVSTEFSNAARCGWRLLTKRHYVVETQRRSAVRANPGPFATNCGRVMVPTRRSTVRAGIDTPALTLTVRLSLSCMPLHELP